MIWEEEQIPAEWKEGYLIKIPKKGDISKCMNYRGITLLSVPGKVFNRILLNRMKDPVDAQLRDQQAGFHEDRSCIDQIATLRIIVEQSLEWNSPCTITSWNTRKHLTAWIERSCGSCSGIMGYLTKSSPLSGTHTRD